MAKARTCGSCRFYTEKTGFLTTRYECLDPSHEGSRRVKEDVPACERYASAIDLRPTDGIFTRAIDGIAQGAGEFKALATGERSRGFGRSVPAKATPRAGDVVPAVSEAPTSPVRAPLASEVASLADASQKAGSADSGRQELSRSEEPPAPPARRLLCDVHTHTLYSLHAYSTLEENVRAAAEQGMELLGIADHYSCMIASGDDPRDFEYYVNLKSWPREWMGVRLMRGAEADIVDLDGHLFGWDVNWDHDFLQRRAEPAINLKAFVFGAVDYAIASVHDKTFTQGTTQVQLTNMYINALDDPKVHILGHVGRTGLDVDVDALVMAARDRGKMIELNEHSFDGPNAVAQANYQRCRHIAERCAELGCMVSTATDAHVSCAVGRMGRVERLLGEIGFPEELVATRSAEAFLAALASAR